MPADRVAAFFRNLDGRMQRRLSKPSSGLWITRAKPTAQGQKA